jgi:hypothetical protein
LSAAAAAPADDEPRFLECVRENFDRAAKLTGIDEGVLDVIRCTNSLLRGA